MEALSLVLPEQNGAGNRLRPLHVINKVRQAVVVLFLGNVLRCGGAPRRSVYAHCVGNVGCHQGVIVKSGVQRNELGGGLVDLCHLDSVFEFDPGHPLRQVTETA